MSKRWAELDAAAVVVVVVAAVLDVVAERIPIAYCDFVEAGDDDIVEKEVDDTYCG